MSGINEKSKSKKTVYRGLCLFCKNANECEFPRDPEQPILHCDEFEGMRIDAGDLSRRKVTLKDPISPANEVKNSEEGVVLGLCRNCSKLKTCTFPKPEGGVWHCEEYE